MAFHDALLRAASDPSAAEALLRHRLEGTALAVVAGGYGVSDDVDVVRSASLLARIHHLLGVHASAAGGSARPSGMDVGLAWLPGPAAAVDAASALMDELEAARDPGSHRHGGLVGVGLASGPVLERPDGRLIGVPVARALRLALAAAVRGELLADAAAGLPEGVGVFQGNRGAVDRMGFPFVHVSDARRPRITRAWEADEDEPT